MTEQREVWPSRDERPYSHMPMGLKPNPEHGNLPPCEMGAGPRRPCPRPATTLIQRKHVCDEHFDWMNTTENRDEAEMGVYHAKRMLWRAQTEDVPRLEHHLITALRELEQDLEEASKREREAWKRAQGTEEDPDVS